MELGFGNSFVILPPLTAKGSIIFGKNSNRPNEEVQELVYEPPKECMPGELLKCTYIEVKQAHKTYGVIISKPAWMWGCEMGANDQGVAIGNSLILTKVTDNTSNSLLGTDLVRLALERSNSAESAVDVITNLLDEYGQKGISCDSAPDLIYQNAFLIVDPNEAWVLETAGKQWVAQKISSGYRNIYDSLSIETQFDKSSVDAKTYAIEKKFWNGTGDFNFAAVYSVTDYKQSQMSLAGQEVLKKYIANNNFRVKDLFSILRDKENKICKADENSICTTASQVSVLLKKKPCCHWFTATPDPSISVFKPFIFTPNVKMSTLSKSTDEDGRTHALYSLHAAAASNENNKVISLLQDMERNCLEEVEKYLDEYEEGQALSEIDELFKDIVEAEVKFYK